MLKKFTVKLSYQANKDLKELLSYMIQMYDDGYYNAKKVNQLIRRRIDDLKFMPENGRIIIENHEDVSQALRMIHIRHYNIFYRIDYTNKLVWIQSIRNARQEFHNT